MGTRVILAVFYPCVFNGFREYISSTATIISTTTTTTSISCYYRVIAILSLEQWLSIFIFVINCIKSGFILYPSSHPLAVAGSAIWNSNLFYATWLGLYGGAHLLVDSFFLNDHVNGGRSNYGDDNSTIMNKLWFMVLFSSVCTFATMMILYSGPSCQGTILAETTYCSSSLTAVLTSAFSALLSCICGSYHTATVGTIRAAATICEEKGGKFD